MCHLLVIFLLLLFFFFFNDTATTEIYTLSLHDALPILDEPRLPGLPPPTAEVTSQVSYVRFHGRNKEKWWRSEEHTSELETRRDLVCRLLLEKKKKKKKRMKKKKNNVRTTNKKKRCTLI